MPRGTRLTINEKDLKTLIEIFDDIFDGFNRSARKPAPRALPEKNTPENFWTSGADKISYASIAADIQKRQAREDAERDRMERIGDLFRYGR